jgi:hypothetical protein
MTDEKLLHILLPHGEERLPVILILVLILVLLKEGRKEGRKEGWVLQCGFSLLSMARLT